MKTRRSRKSLSSHIHRFQGNHCRMLRPETVLCYSERQFCDVHDMAVSNGRTPKCMVYKGKYGKILLKWMMTGGPPILRGQYSTIFPENLLISRNPATRQLWISLEGFTDEGTHVGIHRLNAPLRLSGCYV